MIRRNFSIKSIVVKQTFFATLTFRTFRRAETLGPQGFCRLFATFRQKPWRKLKTAKTSILSPVIAHQNFRPKDFSPNWMVKTKLTLQSGVTTHRFFAFSPIYNRQGPGLITGPALPKPIILARSFSKKPRPLFHINPTTLPRSKKLLVNQGG